MTDTPTKRGRGRPRTVPLAHDSTFKTLFPELGVRGLNNRAHHIRALSVVTERGDAEMTKWLSKRMTMLSAIGRLQSDDVMMAFMERAYRDRLTTGEVTSLIRSAKKEPRDEYSLYLDILRAVKAYGFELSKDQMLDALARARDDISENYSDNDEG